ncbi:MAG: hypothetical protein WC836_05855 [Desulfobacula sp.]
MAEILIVIKTYPEISKKHKETVCTAGILKDLKKIVRIYPVRFRYLDGEQQFSKYQWISAEIEKSTSDIRPESFRVNPDSIIIKDKIGTKDQWAERCEWILNSNHMFDSVEALQNHQSQYKTSLGIVKPKRIIDIEIKKKSEDELNGLIKKKQISFQQLDLFEDNNNDLEIIPYRFFLRFDCEDETCKGHRMSILDWEITQLFRKIKNQDNWQTLIKDKIQKQIFSQKNETFLFLGNMANHQHIFCILGFFYPPKNRQLSLF